MQHHTHPDNHNNQHIIEHTKKWLCESIIEHQFCPYAKAPFENGLVSFQVYEGNDLIELLELFASCCLKLDQTPINQLETTLLITQGADHFLADFHDYLDALDLMNAFLNKPHTMIRRFSERFYNTFASAVPAQWEEQYQIASFHPQYCFSGCQPTAKENLTNQSPYPIFHILRNESIDNVRMNDDKADRIVSRNMSYIQKLNDEAFRKLVALSSPKAP